MNSSTQRRSILLAGIGTSPTRSSGKRFYKRLFLVGVEGSRTECDYFSMFNSAYVYVVPVASREGNCPKKVLAALKAAIQRAKTLLGAADPTDWPREAGKTTFFTLCEAIRHVDAEEEVKMLTDLSGGASNERHCE